MEYLDGENLASLIRRIGRLPQDKAIEFTRMICAGLAAAHERGVLHRDLKPANVMIDGRGQVRITDFRAGGVGALGDCFGEASDGDGDHGVTQAAPKSRPLVDGILDDLRYLPHPMMTLEDVPKMRAPFV